LIPLARQTSCSRAAIWCWIPKVEPVP